MARIAPDVVRRPPLFNLAHVRTLLGMRWKLTVRGYSRGGAASIVGLIFLVLFGVPLVGIPAFFTGVGYLNLAHGLAVQLLFIVLVLLYVGWILLPLLQYTLNEGLDVTRLQIYPITRPELMVSLVLATLFDVGTLVIVAFYVPILIGWSTSLPSGAVTVVALALAYAHTVGISQLVLAAMMGLLRNRRYRDITIVVFALVGVSCSAVGQLFGRLITFGSAASPAAIESLHIDRYLQYTPPGMAARAIDLAARGEYLAALGWLAVLAALVPVLLTVWALVLDRGITSAETAGGAPARRRARRAGQAGAATEEARGAVVGTAAQPAAHPAVGAPATQGERRSPFAPAVLAIASKDARYLWRDPQLKASLLSSLFVLVVVVVPFFAPTRQEGLSVPPVLVAPIPTLFVAVNLSLNSLGLERQALQMLYLFPVRPLDVFWGKNLTVGAVAVAAQIVLTVALAILSGGWLYVPMALAAGVAAILVLMGCGNVTSVLLPFRVREMRMGRNTMSSENGCLRAVLSMVALLVTAVLLLPVAAALVVPLVFQELGWLILALPVAVLYGVGFHQLATRLVAPLMLSRAPEILAATTRE